MAKTAAQKTADYRARMRAKGYRELRVWVPDLRNPDVRARIERDLEALRDHPSNEEGNRFTDAALEDIEGWEA